MQIKRLSAIAFGHFSIDVLSSSIALILTVLSAKFELSISQIGLAAMIYTFAGSLTQPFFGILADYMRGRWLGAISVAWTALFYGLAAFMPNYPLLVTCLTIGALGSGLFHPVGMINAAAAGGPYPATATSIFFLLGQSGLALGPIVAGFVLQSMNIEVGMPLMALGALPAVLVMAVYLSSPMMVASKGKAPALSTPTDQSNVARRALWVGIAFMLVITLRVTTSQSLVTLLPKYFADLGYQPALYGSMIGIFSLGGAIGTFVGGYLGDRYSRRNLLFVATLLSVPFSYGLLHTTGWLFWPLAFLAGALLNVPHSVLVVMAQEFLPKRQGMMGGAALGFTFASGAVMAWIASWFADLVGLAPVLSILAFVPIGAALSALALPAAQPRTIDDSSLSAPAAAD
ncbi:MAG: MFS transporter [Caldilineaceae bacterium]|jgi:FSR family fosmidomycin resistance protein-like MFS transporter